MDGWPVMGDMVSMNPEGFLLLGGRLSRFPHIGGTRVARAASCRNLAELVSILA